MSGKSGTWSVQVPKIGDTAEEARSNTTADSASLENMATFGTFYFTCCAKLTAL
jgi:hypothetical protein